MNSEREVVATDAAGSTNSPLGTDCPRGAEPHDHVIQQLFAFGLAMQSTHRKEQSPEQALRISEHIDQLHDVLEQLRKTTH